MDLGREGGPSSRPVSTAARSSFAARWSLLCLSAAVAGSCVYSPVEGDDDDWDEASTLSTAQGIAVAGRWVMPASVRAIAAT